MATQAWELDRTTRALVADVLWALVAANKLDEHKGREPAVAEACHVLGIDPTDYRAAIRRNPHGRLLLAEPRAAPAGSSAVVPLPRRRQQATRERPRNRSGQLFCNTCRLWKVEDDFAPRADRPGSRKSACRPCLSDHQRRHYLTAAEIVRSGKPGVVEAESVLTLEPCARCGGAIEAGQSVEAIDVAVAHCTCPTSPPTQGRR